MNNSVTNFLMSGNFNYPQASIPFSDPSSPEQYVPFGTIDPRATRTEFVSRQAAITQQQRAQAERLRTFDEETRWFTASRSAARRQTHGAEQTGNAHGFTRPRAIGSRLRRRLTGTFAHSRRGPLQFAPVGGSHHDFEEPTLPRIASPDIVAAEYSGEAEVNRRRKRRKLGDGRPSAYMDGFKYGWRGQVLPGKLRMEIHECDGGLLSDSSAQGRQLYRPENLLRNDKSVYCTGKSTCNIILRHVGETCFTLKKLVIKAPEKGFNSPIQEGMVFISMTATNLIGRTTAYNLHRNAFDGVPSDDESSIGSSTTSEFRPISRRHDSSPRMIPPPISNALTRFMAQAADGSENGGENSESETLGTSWFGGNGLDQDADDNSSSSAAVIAQTLAGQSQGFNITTHCNDPSEDEEEDSSLQILADRYARDHLPSNFITATSEEETVADYPTFTALRMRQFEQTSVLDDTAMPDSARFPSRLRMTARGLESITRSRATPRARFEGANEQQPAGESNDADLLAPHATFAIARDKSVVSISFEPAVCGKYILLKLWSPRNSTNNIDIQSVVAHGFAGPRMFAAAGFT